MLKDYHVLIFSPRLKAVAQGRFPPVFHDEQEPLFRAAQRLVGKRDPEVAIFHQGGVSFPVLTFPS